MKQTLMLTAVLLLTPAIARAEECPIPRQGLALWLSAENTVIENGEVVRLRDSSGAGNDAVRESDPKIVAGNPTLSKHEESEQQVLRFNGAFTGYEFKAIDQIRSVFLVVSKNPAAFKKFAERFVLGGKEKKQTDFHVGCHWTDTIIELGTFKHGKAWFNGFPIDPALSEFSPRLAVVTLIAGRDTIAQQIARDRDFIDRSWHGDIGEIIIYTRALSDGERKAVEDYLLNKYRIEPFKPVTVPRETVLPGHTKPPAPGVKPEK